METPAPRRPQLQPLVALSLGANLGEAEATLRWAVEALAPHLEAPRVAPLYRSPPEGGPPQPDYTNTAVLATTALEPEELLAVAKSLEHAAGRRPGPRYGPRPLDVDLLLWGDLELRRPELTLPHPRLRRRRFYLEPLAALDPGLIVPPEGVTLAELLDRLSGGRALDRHDWSRPPLAG